MAFPLTHRMVVSSFLPVLSVSKPPTSAFPCFSRRMERRRVLNPALWFDLGKNANANKNVSINHSFDDTEAQRRKRLLWLMDQYLKNDVSSIQKSIVDHVEYTIARSRFKFDDFEAYKATAISVRDRLLESWNDTQQFYRDNDSKRVYYLSMEFLMGSTLGHLIPLFD